MKYLDGKPFSVHLSGSDAFAEGWERVFGKKPRLLITRTEVRHEGKVTTMLMDGVEVRDVIPVDLATDEEE